MTAPTCMCNPRSSQRCSFCEDRLLAKARGPEPGGPHDGVRIDRLAVILRAVATTSAGAGGSAPTLADLLDLDAAAIDASEPPPRAWQRLAEHFLRELHAPYGTLPPGDKPQT